MTVFVNMMLLEVFVINTCFYIVLNFLLILALNVASVTWADEVSHKIYGTQNNDELHGTSFDDEIHGGAGDDVIYGGLGADTLFGGLGADQFVVNASELGEVDTIKDFSPQEGDNIILKFRSPSIKNIHIPKELGSESVKLDNKGNLKILMDNKEWLSLMNLQDSNMYIQVENESNFIRFVFNKDF